MIPQKTKFSNKWLERSIMDDEDSHTYGINIWHEGCPNDEYSIFCKFCNKTFSIINMRFGQIPRSRTFTVNLL